MMPSAIKYDVELLRDGKGIYGIGVAREAETNERPKDLVLRRDRLPESQTSRAVLQMITGGFRYGVFTETSEDNLRRVIHHGLLCRAELPWPPNSPDVRYWSSEPRQQTRNRQIYHGLRKRALSVVNGLIGCALEEAADLEAVTIARRFQFKDRYAIYRAATLSPRALQLVAVFPALALAIFARSSSQANHPIEEAARLVDVGAPLKTIAELMRVPMAFRKVKPGAADLALSVRDAFHDHRLVHAYMPNSLPHMKQWLRCIKLAEGIGPDFVEWVAKYSLEIGGAPDEARSFLGDLTDWVQASYRASVPTHIFKAILGDDLPTSRGEQFVVRPFSPDMSLKTVAKLSSDWHEAVANNMSGPACEFPEPWCGAGNAFGYEIVPIITAVELYREGHAMRHCVGSNASSVHEGTTYFYSVRKNTERVATFELIRVHDGVAIGQLRGPCNGQVSKQVVGAVKSWLGSQREFHFPEEHSLAIADGELPF